jgi:hypothetical protein
MTAMPPVPELPPGYRVGESDEGWIIGDRESWIDDDVHGQPQDTRDDAVFLAWDHWSQYVASEEWREFMARHTERDMARALERERLGAGEGGQP